MGPLSRGICTGLPEANTDCFHPNYILVESDQVFTVTSPPDLENEGLPFLTMVDIIEGHLPTLKSQCCGYLSPGPLLYLWETFLSLLLKEY